MSTIRKHLSEVSEGMSLIDMEEVGGIVMALEVIRKNGGTVFLFGNGGSHATAGHLANDLMKMAKIKAVCIGDMGSSMTAYGNDNGWVNMFTDPLRKLLGERDGVIGISCSGKSENVLSALGYAIENGNLTIGMTGQSESSEINHIGLNALFHAKYPDIRVQEDLHMMVCHAVVRTLQEL